MEYDKEKVAELVLALLYLNKFKDGPSSRAWKGFDWDALDRLHEQGYIHDAKGKAKSVVFTKEGEEQAAQLFNKHFALNS